MKAVCKNQQESLNFITQVVGQYGLVFDKPLELTAEVKRSRRSLEQNNYLNGVCYKIFLEESGLSEQGWRRDDIHNYFLGEYFGWESLEAFGRKRLRPVHRSSTLKKDEFSGFIDYIHQKAAEYGVVIPDPEEQ